MSFRLKAINKLYYYPQLYVVELLTYHTKTVTEIRHYIFFFKNV